jgi:NAD(P)-dependent dehydrogenase (short-subunit alcohol dehydrogenase family)
MSKLSLAGFTNIGYRIHARSFEPVVTDMSGKTVLITGATGGLGKATASALARLGAKVIIVGRDEGKLAQIVEGTPGDVVTVQADLSLMADIRRLADGVLHGEQGLDVLVNNVGVLLPDRTLTDERLETTFATNLAGHFLLTNLLMPMLVGSAQARVINVSSGGMYSERIVPNDLQSALGEFRGSRVYARTKRGQVILTEMWAERLDGTGVVVHAMHPGWAGTAGLEQSLPVFSKLMRPFLRTVEQGADTIVWLAAAEEPSRSTGSFWFDRAVAPTHLTDSTHEQPGDRRALWNALVEITASDLP